MGLTRVRVVIHQGYLKIRTTANRKSKYKTLSIPMDSAHWNKETEEVRKSHPYHYKYNQIIKEELRKHYLYGELPTKSLYGEPDIVAYFKRIIKNIANPGTKQVKTATLKKFIGYLQKNNLNELRFSDLTAERVDQFYNHLLGEVHINTAGHHIRQFKSVINKAIKEGKATYLTNPFLGIKTPSVEPQIYGLSEIEISQLMQAQNVDGNKHLGAFLFSLFAQGMRKSDMLLLRWENFNYEYEKLLCSFTTKKTKKPTTIILNHMAILYLEPQIRKYYPEIKKSLKRIHSLIREHQVLVEKYQNLIEKYNEGGDEENREIRKEWFNLVREHSKPLPFEWSIDALNQKLLEQETIVQEYESEIRNEISVAVNNLSSVKPKDFVFDYLRGESISKYQNDKEWKIIDNKSKLYNYHLKKSAQAHGFKKLTPHIARHSYARMLDESNTSIQTIQKLIGHSNPKRTIGYMRRLNNNAEVVANTELGERFNSIRYQGIPWNHFK